MRHALAPAYRAVLALLLLAGPSLAAQAIAPLSVRAVEYKSDDIEVPAVLAGPRSGGPYPGVIFVHGRGGWHDRLRAEALRLAERGFISRGGYHAALLGVRRPEVGGIPRS